MRLISLVFILLLMVSIAVAQDGTIINRYKFYDTTKAEDFQKINRRRLTADVDATGVSIYAWGSECYFKINLLDRMLINATVYDYMTVNGRPAVKYGNSRYRFRMYINKSDNFELDIEIRAKSPSGRYRFPFNIEHKGLTFYWQDSTLITNDPNAEPSSPDVLNSYTVMHSSGRHNSTNPDGSVNNYGSGIAFTMLRPVAWDATGDTVWANLKIDTLKGRMIVWVDSTWNANAVYPVTIDPQLGNTTIGSIAFDVTSDIRYAEFLTTEAGTLDSITMAYAGLGSPSAFHAIYADDGDASSTNGPDDLLEAETTGNTISAWPNEVWLQTVMAGFSMVDATIYWAASRNTGGSTVRIAAVSTSGSNDSAEDPLTAAFPATSTASGTLDYAFSMFFTYTVAGGPADDVYVRRKRQRSN